VLRRAGVPFRVGLQASPPRLVLTVPEEWLEHARLLAEDLQEELEELEELERARPSPPARFPRGPFRLCAGLALLHVAIVVLLVGAHPTLQHFLRLGAVSGDRLLQEPWRLLTSLLLHADLQHAAWNGLALVAFGVPVLERLRLPRAGTVYLGAGIGGGLLATLGGSGRTVLLGASGAISGLFGAWLVEGVAHLARVGPRRTRRDVLRVAGLALLYLPALLNPTTPQGGRVSVAAHVGGLLTGALLAWGFLHREARSGSGSDPASPPH
jgi:rhomboid protease GluP